MEVASVQEWPSWTANISIGKNATMSYFSDLIFWIVGNSRCFDFCSRNVPEKKILMLCAVHVIIEITLEMDIMDPTKLPVTKSLQFAIGKKNLGNLNLSLRNSDKKSLRRWYIFCVVLKCSVCIRPFVRRPLEDHSWLSYTTTFAFSVVHLNEVQKGT